ncbi:HRSL1 enzyme, partial [Certhia brachydactyla]|nr:HRSL1 enzyme [Certhia brachydactyla]
EIDRGHFKHWVLYMENGYVVHKSPIGEEGPSISGSTASINSRRAKVKMEPLEKVKENNNWCVNKKYDSTHTPLPGKEIIRRAKRWINKEVPYDVLYDNCEHFVTMLRYGEPLSDQVSDT